MPLKENTPHCDYYRQNPEWYMYGRSDRPHHSEIMAARNRVLFGTDRTLFGSQKGRAEELRRDYATQFAYFETDAPVQVAGNTYRGIALPESVQRKFYWENARAWFRR